MLFFQWPAFWYRPFLCSANFRSPWHTGYGACVDLASCDSYLTLIPNFLITGNILYDLDCGQRWQLTGRVPNHTYVEWLSTSYTRSAVYFCCSTVLLFVVECIFSELTAYNMLRIPHCESFSTTWWVTWQALKAVGSMRWQSNHNNAFFTSRSQVLEYNFCDWPQRGGFIWTTNATDTAWRTPVLSCNRYHGYFKRLREKSHLGIYSLEGKYEKMWNMQTAVHVLGISRKFPSFRFHRDHTRGCALSLCVVVGSVGVSFVKPANLTYVRV